LKNARDSGQAITVIVRPHARPEIYLLIQNVAQPDALPDGFGRLDIYFEHKSGKNRIMGSNFDDRRRSRLSGASQTKT
jgi:hypothetical protein